MTTTQLVPNDNSSKELVEIADQISNIIESFIEVGILVHDNQGTPQSNAALSSKMQQLTRQLKHLSNVDPKLIEDYKIPIDVISYVEDGRNPDIYTREFVEVSAKLNARLKGKMQGFAKLQEVLGDKLQTEFPRLEKGVENVKTRTSG